MYVYIITIQNQKASAPAPGTVITFKYFELTKDGIPRFPTFLRVRPDVNPSDFPSTHDKL